MSALIVSDRQIRSVYTAMKNSDNTITADVILCNPVFRRWFLKELDVEFPEVEEAALRRLINLRKSKRLEPKP